MAPLDKGVSVICQWYEPVSKKPDTYRFVRSSRHFHESFDSTALIDRVHMPTPLTRRVRSDQVVQPVEFTIEMFGEQREKHFKLQPSSKSVIKEWMQALRTMAHQH